MAIEVQSDHPIPLSARAANWAKGKGSKTKAGKDKWKRFGWNDIGKPGEFMMCDKTELYIDHGYQRDRIGQDKINEMAASWDWVACGCLCVAVRNGKWYVIDGQHRKMAADKRSDIKDLPCLVFELESRSHEAQAFVDLNSSKTAVDGVDRFKAMVVAGDQTAKGLKELLDQSGRVAAAFPSPRTVACIVLLWKRYRKDAEMFARVWKLICEMAIGQQVNNPIVRSVWWAECRASEQNKSLCNEPYRTALVNAGVNIIKSEVERERAIVGVGGARVEGAALVKWLNRQKLGHAAKLSLD